MDPLKVAWAAGFMDGEGTFGVQIRKDAYRVFPYYLYVAAGQVKPGALEVLVELFGGTIRVQRSMRSAQFYYGTHFMWQVYGARAVEVARVLQPHLRIKRRQAEILCEMYPFARKRGRRFETPQTFADVEYLNALAVECRSLNKRRTPIPDPNADRLSGETPEAVPGEAIVGTPTKPN